MDNPERLYSYFLKALEHEVTKEGHGGKSFIANKANLSGAFIGQVLNPNSKKRAKLETQKKVAMACGYTYEDFLTLGKELLEGSNDHKSGAENTETTQPPIGNVIRVYNNILDKTGIKLNPEGQEKLFNLVRRRLAENAEKAVQEEFIDIISISDRKAEQ